MRVTQNLLRVFLLVFGMAAYAQADGDGSVSSLGTVEKSDGEVVLVDATVQEEILPPCPEEDCQVTDDFLTKSFVTERDISLYQKPTAEIVALSRPLTKASVSVKEKINEKKAVADVVEEKKEERQTSEAEQKATIVLTKETKVEETKVSKEGKDVIMATSERVAPLKKVKTTITETTTRIQDNPNDKIGADLNDKIRYGEEVHDWEASAGSTLRGLLMGWSAKSGWTLVWKLDRDYHLEAGVVFRGTFTDVSSALVRSFARATPAPIGTFYQGNRVLLIGTQEDENAR